MSKKPVKKSAKYDGPMTNGMKFFLAGCVAQLYLLIVNRFYINGTMKQVFAWIPALKVLTVLGLVAAVVGAVLVKKGPGKFREIFWYLTGGGAFLAAASGIVSWNMDTLALLLVIVPAVLVIDVLWWLFDRGSALSLTVLAAAAVVIWVNRRAGGMMIVKAASVAALLALGAVLWAVKQGKVKKLSVGMMFYASCAIAAAGIACALVSSAVAYYAMWVLAAAIFCVAVYYTVKQL